MSGAQLHGRVFAVTGAASGIGAAVARALIDAGARVALAYLDAAGCRATRDHLDPGGRATLAAILDVRDRAATAAMADRCEAELGGLDGLIAAAGIARVAPAEAMSDDDWDAVIGINLTGAFRSAQVFGERLLRSGRGAIVLIGSVSSFGGHPGRASYCASKAGLLGLTKVLALEWGARGVRVNGVAPNAVDTPMVRARLPAAYVEGVIEDRTALGRIARPDEIAQACLFLLSDASSYVNGVMLPVDGGLTAGFLTRRHGQDVRPAGET